MYPLLPLRISYIPMVTLDCLQSLNVSNFSLAEYHGMVLYLVLLSMVVVIGPFSG
jgi:hypothetical protein